MVEWRHDVGAIAGTPFGFQIEGPFGYPVTVRIELDGTEVYSKTWTNGAPCGDTYNVPSNAGGQQISVRVTVGTDSDNWVGIVT